MMRFHEKQLYKKILHVVDLRFYARFLALYASKMKREWIRKDEDFSGGGLKKYVDSCWTKRLIKNEAEYKKMLKKLEKHSEIYELGCESATDYYPSKWQKGVGKKRKKKYKELWKETISLKEYEGKMQIDQTYVLKRRKIRYIYEDLMHLIYGYIREGKKEVKIIYKGERKICFSEPRERRL
jgi:hypothetical protein